DGTRTTVAELGGGPNGCALGPDGALYVVNNGGAAKWRDAEGLMIPGRTVDEHVGGYIQRVDLTTGEAAVLYGQAQAPLLAPNDIVFDHDGGFWFTDSGVTIQGGRRFGA